MMMHLTFTIYVDGEGNDRFKVYSPTDDEEVHECTGDYDMMTVCTNDGRTGFAVFKKEPVKEENDGAAHSG